MRRRVRACNSYGSRGQECVASLSGVNLSSGLSDGECLNAIALGTLNLDRAFYSSGEDEADCFINDPRAGGIPPP